MSIYWFLSPQDSSYPRPLLFSYSSSSAQPLVASHLGHCRWGWYSWPQAHCLPLPSNFCIAFSFPSKIENWWGFLLLKNPSMPPHCFPVFLCRGLMRFHPAWIHLPGSTRGFLLLEVISLRALAARLCPVVPRTWEGKEVSQCTICHTSGEALA